MRLFAGIDLGTGGARCLVADERGHRVSFGAHPWSTVTDASGFAVLDARTCLDAVHRAIAGALEGCDRNDIAGAGITAQRTGVVLLDGDGNEIVVSPNSDGRGALHGIAMERAHGELAYRIAGRLPVMLYLPARLAWFASEQPEVAARVRTALSLSDWIVWSMTGRASTEPTQAAEMLCFDVASGRWSDELCAAFGIDASILPEVLAPGVSSGKCNGGLLDGIPIVPAGADSQVAALAMGAIDPGESIVVAGTTMIAARVTHSGAADPQGKTWTSPHAIEGRFVREAHCGEAGAALDWCARTFGISVDEFSKLAAEAPPGAGGVRFVDPQPSVAKDFALVRRAGFTFAAPLLALGRERADLARAAVEGTAFAAAAGLEALGAHDVAAAGGVTRAEIFGRALAGALNRPVRVATEPNGSALGAAIVAAAQHYGGVREAVNAMRDAGREVTPVETDGYPSHYAEWKQDAARFDAQALKVSML